MTSAAVLKLTSSFPAVSRKRDIEKSNPRDYHKEKKMDLNAISNSLQSGKAKETSELIIRAIQENHSIENIVKQGLIAGMYAVEQRYRQNEIFIAEVLTANRAMKMGINVLKPVLNKPRQSYKGAVVIGTVKGDMRDTEKNLMAIMMQGMGLRVIDLGAGIGNEQFIEQATAEKAQIIACTAALPAAMTQMKGLVQALKIAGIRDQVKIMIAGAPVTERYCEIIGADIYASDAVNAAELASAYCSKTAAFV
jgi:methanogenic corrinoid protein MtbC1